MHSVDKSTGVRQKSVPYMLAGASRPYDLVNVPQECPYLSNTCQVLGFPDNQYNGPLLAAREGGWHDIQTVKKGLLTSGNRNVNSFKSRV